LEDLPRNSDPAARWLVTEPCGRGAFLRMIHGAPDTANNPLSELELRRRALSQASKSSTR
jgi:hypothetical protein